MSVGDSFPRGRINPQGKEEIRRLCMATWRDQGQPRYHQVEPTDQRGPLPVPDKPPSIRLWGNLDAQVGTEYTLRFERDLLALDSTPYTFQGETPGDTVQGY